MSRALRCTTVWTVVTLSCVATVWLLAPDLVALGRVRTWRGDFDDALVPVCSAVTTGCAAWFWSVTTATAVEVLRGASPATLAERRGARRLVLVLCGVAVVSGLTAPAHAAERDGSGSDGVPSLAGLSVPDRASAGAVRERPGPAGRTDDRSPGGPAARPLARPGFADAAARPRTAAAPDVTVRPGDSLWSIAEDTLGPDADVAALVDHWHRTYQANRHVVGADPDLILPGQQLALPPGVPDHRSTTRQTTRPPSDDSDHEEQP